MGPSVAYVRAMGRTLHFERRSRLGVSSAEAFAWHLRAGAFERLVPPGDGTRVAGRTGRIEDDTMRVELSVPVAGPIRQAWTIRHEGFVDGRRFVDVMEQGPFSSWRHEHLVEPIDEQSCELVDSIHYQLPLGALGATLGRPIVEAKLRPMFDHRHAVTAADLAAHRAAALEPLRVELRGPWAGRLGTQLAAFLSTGGHDVAGQVELVGADLLPAHASPDAVVERGTGRTVRVHSPATGDQPIVVEAADDPVAGPRQVLATIAGLHATA